MDRTTTMSKILCIYHGNCADGFGAAWAVRHALGSDQVEFHPGIYGNDPPDVRGRDVVLVDFSYKRPVIDAMGRAASSVLILDHHKTAADDLTGLKAPTTWLDHIEQSALDSMENAEPVRAVFDMNRSGAGIAWDFFHPGQPRPRLRAGPELRKRRIDLILPVEPRAVGCVSLAARGAEHHWTRPDPDGSRGSARGAGRCPRPGAELEDARRRSRGVREEAMTDRTPEPQTADNLIPFPRLGEHRPRSAQFIAEFVGELAELSEPCRAGSEYLNRPCRSPNELEAMLRVNRTGEN